MLVDGHGAGVRRQGVPDRREFVGRVEVEVPEAAPQGGVGQEADRRRGLGALGAVDLQEDEPGSVFDPRNAAEQDRETSAEPTVSAFLFSQRTP